MAKASTLLKQARAWVGAKEGGAVHKEIVKIYNSHKPHPRGYALKTTDSWCAAFVSALAIKCNATNIIPVECSCQKMIELCKKAGIWVENDAHIPKEGHIIFYDWQDSGKGDNVGWSDHVGIVETVTAGAIIVIEGNYSDSVKCREIKVNAKTIRGFAVPKYEAEKIAMPKPTTGKSNEEIAKEVLAGKWGNGKARKEALEKAGYNYAAIQKIINNGGAASTTGEKKKSNEEIAKEVLAGKWGNGKARKEALEKAGYNYAAIQKIVNMW